MAYSLFLIHLATSTLAGVLFLCGVIMRTTPIELLVVCSAVDL